MLAQNTESSSLGNTNLTVYCLRRQYSNHSKKKEKEIIFSRERDLLLIHLFICFFCLIRAVNTSSRIIWMFTLIYCVCVCVCAWLSILYYVQEFSLHCVKNWKPAYLKSQEMEVSAELQHGTFLYHHYVNLAQNLHNWLISGLGLSLWLCFSSVSVCL